MNIDLSQVTAKTRIAIVISIFWLVFSYLGNLIGDPRYEQNLNLKSFSLFSLPVFIYWAYRFVKSAKNK
jgi:hypothetical protein